MSDHLALWRQIERTDPAHVKAITGKSYKGNSPKPHFLIFKATETFGPAGIGWGFDIVEEKLLDGALIAPGFYERIHMARVRVWYEWNGKRGQVEHVGQTAFCGKRNSGQTYTDEDAPKKSVTDALIKALSMIGFAGDIFMGRYDDSRYVADLRKQLAEEAEAAKVETPAEIPGEEEARDKYIAGCFAHIREATDGKALGTWWNGEKKARRDFELTQDEVDSLKAALSDKLQAIGSAAPAPPAKANGHPHHAQREEARPQ